MTATVTRESGACAQGASQSLLRKAVAANVASSDSYSTRTRNSQGFDVRFCNVWQSSVNVIAASLLFL